MSREKIEELALEISQIEEERLEHDRASRKLKTVEDNLRASLIKAMHDDNLTTLETDVIYIGVTQSVRPTIMSWEELEKFIREHNAVDLLQKRLTESAVKLRWDDGIQVPGVGIQTVDKVTVKQRN